MNIHIMHDDAGNIKVLAVPGPRFVETVRLLPEQETKVSVVEGPDLTGDELYEHLRRLHQEFRVDMSSGTPTLVQK